MKYIFFTGRVVSSLGKGLAAASLGPAPTDAAAQRRPVPYPVDVPSSFARALANGTRSPTGAPGAAYWQQWANYTITARLRDSARIDGWDYEQSERVNLEPGRYFTITFRAETGGFGFR